MLQGYKGEDGAGFVSGNRQCGTGENIEFQCNIQKKPISTSLGQYLNNFNPSAKEIYSNLIYAILEQGSPFQGHKMPQQAL